MILYQIGHRGPEIAKLQSMLNRQSSTQPRLAVDGDFGPHTQEAVQCFQTLQHQKADGVVMDETWHALEHKSRRQLTLGEPYWLQIARAEQRGRLSFSQRRENWRIHAYHRLTRLRHRDQQTPCSSSFINWVMHRAGLPGTRSAAPESWLAWGAAIAQPASGAVTVIRRKGPRGAGSIMGTEAGYLAGLLISKTATWVRLLGADQDNRIRDMKYDLRDYELVGYRWPEPRRVRIH